MHKTMVGQRQIPKIGRESNQQIHQDIGPGRLLETNSGTYYEHYQRQTHHHPRNHRQIFGNSTPMGSPLFHTRTVMDHIHTFLENIVIQHYRTNHPLGEPRQDHGNQPQEPPFHYLLNIHDGQRTVIAQGKPNEQRPSERQHRRGKQIKIAGQGARNKEQQTQFAVIPIQSYHKQGSQQ